jgi:uncharacterized repeat protein (TIGR04138 family)
MLTHSQLEQKIAQVAESCGVAPQGLQFILHVAQNSSQLGEHVEGAEFCWRVHDRALLAYGTDAKQALTNWSLCSTEDIGRAVFALVEAKLMLASDSDSLTDFENVFAFEDAFERPRYKTAIQSSSQFTIFSLIAVTVIAAIAVAGAVKNGFAGVYMNLAYGWLFALGSCCLFLGYKERGGMRIFLCGAGALLAVVGGLILFGEAAGR